MLAPGDAAVLAHILRTDPHLHPPRHPDRLHKHLPGPGQIGWGHHRFTLQPWGNPNQSQPTTTPDQQPTSAPTPHAQHHPATPAASTPCYSPQAPPPAAATYDHRQSRVALRPVSFSTQPALAGFTMYSIRDENAYSTTEFVPSTRPMPTALRSFGAMPTNSPSSSSSRSASCSGSVA